jgi:soluble lytic murein transglycosylase-like protein
MTLNGMVQCVARSAASGQIWRMRNSAPIRLVTFAAATAMLALGAVAPLRSKPANPAPVAPSAFQQEQRMTFGQLMHRWNGEIATAARRFGIPDIWIRAVMQVESGGRAMLAENRPIKSRAGAMGLMQLMPETYADMRAQYGLGADAYNPHDNIVAGAAYLKWLRGRYGYPEMFAAYNDGPGHLDRRLKSAGLLPLETRNYLVRVTGMVSGGHGTQVKFTRPNGQPVMIDIAAVSAVRAAFPGEYAACVRAVITVGHVQQGVCEPLAKARALIRARGGAA